VNFKLGVGRVLIPHNLNGGWMTEGKVIYPKQEVYEAALELKRRYEDSKILFYKPCCRAHKNQCPVVPCPDSKHMKFHLSDKKVRIVFGGNRSGKSILGLMELLLCACFKTHPFRKTANPKKGRYRIYSPDFSIIEKLYIPLIKEWIPRECLSATGENKGEAWEKSYDSRNHILKLKGNTMIDFMSYDQDTSKSESVELDGVWGDEEMPEEVYSAVAARLISRNGKFWLTVTPLYGISWAMKFLDTLEPHEEIYNFNIYDNPYISEQAIKEFESSIPEHEKEARIHGRFLELQGLVYKELRTDVHLLGSDNPEVHCPVIFTMDPHPRKPTVMTWAYVTPKDDLVFFDELEMAGTARDVVHAIRAKESSHSARTMLRLIDPAAKAQGSNFVFETDTLKEFEHEGMSFSLADNSEAGYNVVKEMLTYNQSLPMGAMNRPRMFFTKDCPKTWYGMTHLMWDEWTFKRSLRDEKERIKDYKKDFPDCVRYTAAGRPTYRSFKNIQPVTWGNYTKRPGLSPEQAEHRREFRKLVFGDRAA